MIIMMKKDDHYDDYYDGVGEHRTKSPVSPTTKSMLPHEVVEQNSWFICLQADQLQGCPKFLKLYEYARKMNDALSKKYRVLFKTYNLTLQDFKILTDEVFEHETTYRGLDILPNPYDYDPSGL